MGYQEYLVLLVRTHGIKSLLKSIPWVFFFFLLFLFLFPLFRLGMIGSVLFFVCLGIDLFFIFRILITWYGTCFIITNQRVIIVIRTGYFKKNVQETPFSSIAEISYQTNGFLQMLLSFGSIKLTFPPPREPFFLHSIGRPETLLDTLSRLIVTAKNSSPRFDSFEDQHENRSDSFEKKDLAL